MVRVSANETKKKKESNNNGKSVRQRGNTTKQNKKMTETDSDRKSEERWISPLISFLVEEESCEADD